MSYRIAERMDKGRKVVVLYDSQNNLIMQRAEKYAYEVHKRYRDLTAARVQVSGWGYA